MASAVNSNTKSIDPSSIICRYHVRGMCRFGDFCRFMHLDVDEPANDLSSVNRRNSTSTANVGSALESNSGNLEKTNDPNSWVMAPVFVPKFIQRSVNDPGSSASCLGPIINNSAGASKNFPSTSVLNDTNKSYASVVMGPGAIGGEQNQNDTNIDSIVLCPYQLNCAYGDLCIYEHNKLCDMCGRYCLHPTDKEQRKKHITACIQQHEKDMELSFAVARSKDKTCGICFDIIMEKSGREQRFGILPNCNHIFCLQCIRKWRQAKQFDNKIIRACPECRIPSDYVCPSAFWVETKDEKDKLIGDYKNALGEKDCKYFKKGEGKCPFGNKCFYKHALPDGELVDVGVPKRNKRKIQRAEDEILDLFDLYLWDFVDRREFNWLDIITHLSDSGDSDWSDESE